MLTCHDVANYFLAQTDEDAGDLLSNLKLQKLLYYAQGFHLAMYDTPLFEESIEAWAHGLVVPDCYHNHKQFGSGGIPRPEDLDFSIYHEDTRDLLDEVYRVFGQFSAWKLRNMTHDEPPWKDASETASIITHESMREYFKTQLVRG
jgi:uncharacterized phage-associated protein